MTGTQNPTKILICTHSANSATGLGATTRNIFIPLLKKYPGKYGIIQLGNFHTQEKLFDIPWQIVPTKEPPQGYPPNVGYDQFGQVSFNEIVEKVRPDIVFGYGDMWHFDHILTSPLRNSYRMLSYYTIDGNPYYGGLHGDGSTDWGRKLLKTDKLVVLSHFGVRCLKESCPELKDMDIDVRYHPLDPAKHKHLSPEDKVKFKSQFLPPLLAKDSFIIGFCGRNQFRKQNYKLWEVMHYLVYGDYIECQDCNKITVKEYNYSKRDTQDFNLLTLYDAGYDYSYCSHCKSGKVKAGSPISNIYMWLHMPKSDAFYNSDMHERMWKISNRCIYTKGLDGVKGIPEQVVFDIFSTWDCMFHPSGGEGFNNPMFECMAGGVPVVYSNYASHAEFAKFGGLPVRVTYIPEPATGIQRSIVDTNHAVEQILRLYRDEKLRLELGSKGRAHVLQYNVDTMSTAWDLTFSELMKKPLPIAGTKMYSTII